MTHAVMTFRLKRILFFEWQENVMALNVSRLPLLDGIFVFVAIQIGTNVGEKYQRSNKHG